MFHPGLKAIIARGAQDFLAEPHKTTPKAYFKLPGKYVGKNNFYRVR